MRRAIICFAVLCAALVTWACKESTPEEKVAKARARYSVTLNGFFAKEPPPPEPEPEPAADEAGEAVAVAAEAAAAEAEADAETDEEMDEEEAGPRPVDILLDLIVQHDLDDALPGVTVDIVMVDPEKSEKGAWKVYIETAGLPEANQKQITHVLEDVEYEEGDAFSAEIRSYVPPEEYGDYREFSEAAP